MKFIPLRRDFFGKSLCEENIHITETGGFGNTKQMPTAPKVRE